MNYLILEVGYSHMAIPCKDGIGEVLSLIADARVVTSTGYGSEERWIPSEGDLPRMRFVSEDRVTIGNEVATLQAKLSEVTAEKETRDRWLEKERKKVSELKKQLEGEDAA